MTNDSRPFVSWTRRLVRSKVTSLGPGSMRLLLKRNNARPSTAGGPCLIRSRQRSPRPDSRRNRNAGGTSGGKHSAEQSKQHGKPYSDANRCGRDGELVHQLGWQVEAADHTDRAMIETCECDCGAK